MPKEIILDKRTFEALAIDTRVDILKSLKERNKTASELSKEMKLAVSTVSEHLDKMKKASLIKRKEDHRKWVYYQLTEKGRNIISPKSTSVFVFALSISIFLIVIGMYWFDIGGVVSRPIYSGPSFSRELRIEDMLGGTPAGSQASYKAPNDSDYVYTNGGGAMVTGDDNESGGAGITAIPPYFNYSDEGLELPNETENVTPQIPEEYDASEYEDMSLISMASMPWLYNLSLAFVVIGGGLLLATFVWWFRK